MASTYWPDANRIPCPFAGSLAVSINSLMWSDTAGLLVQGNAYPATSVTDQGTESANQTYFGSKFIGVAREVLSATQTQTTILIDRVFVGPMAIDSDTYYQGDLVAACELASGIQLSNAKVKKTTTAADAIGFVLHDSGGAVTTVTVCLLSRVLPKYMPHAAAVNTTSLEFDDGANIAVNTTTGTKIGTATAQKLGFWAADPVIQQASADQAATALTMVGDDMTVGAAVGASTATNAGWGFASAANYNTALANIDALRVDTLALNVEQQAALVDITAINTLVNEMRDNLVSVGIIKGEA